MHEIVAFKRMEDGTRADYELLDRSERAFAARLPEFVLGALRKLDTTLVGYPVSRLQHSLQAATRARRDGADDEWVLAALIHDVGDELAPNRNARDQHLAHPWYGACRDFCANWDQCSFDPSYPWEPLEGFEPLVREIFGRRAHDPAVIERGRDGASS